MVANAQAIITISRKRLCNCADKDTVKAWNMALEELNKINPTLVSCCVADCVYRGHCMEHTSCNYHKTFAFKEELEMYRENINQ